MNIEELITRSHAMAVEKGAKAVGNKAPSSTVDTVVNTVVQTEEKEADQ